MPYFITQKDIPGETLLPHLKETRQQLRQQLLTPGLTDEHKEAIRETISEIDQKIERAKRG